MPLTDIEQTDLEIELSGVCYRHSEGGQPQEILKGVDLHVRRGERVALLGRSGSGKSTLLNLVSGIDRCLAGDIRVCNQPVATLQEPALTLFRRQHIGFVYQFFNLIPLLTLQENVALPLELLGRSGKQQQQTAMHWLELVGLAERASAYPDQLSGGEQQRVAIARALVHEPAVILADEPTGNLDAANGHRVLELLEGLVSDHQKTLLMVTHSREVATVTDRQLALVEGRLDPLAAASTW